MPNERKPIHDGKIITLTFKNENESEYKSKYRIIGDPIGAGSSCLVYYAKELGEFGHKAVIKEFYPKSFRSRFQRGEDGVSLCFSDENGVIADEKMHFIEGLKKQIEYCENETSHTMFGNAELAVNDGDVPYLVSGFTHGEVLSRCRDSLTFRDTITVIKSLCNAIDSLHCQKKLFLDIKPSNIFVKEIDDVKHISLFDFDSVVDYEGNGIRSSENNYSDYWCSPEQKNGFLQSIDQRTDIFSIGAVFYWLISGKETGEDWLSDISDYISSKNIDIKNRYGEKAFSKLNNFFSHTLSPKQDERFINCGEMRVAINDLLKIITDYNFREYLDTQCRVSKNSTNPLHYSYCGDDKFKYIPRREEDLVLSFLNSDGKRFGQNGIDFSWWSVAGEAGSGKSRFAYEIGEKLKLDNSWNVYFIPQHACEYLASPHTKEDSQHITQWDYDDNLLLVFDYAAMMSSNIGKFLSIIEQEKTLTGGKLRILFIERQGLMWQDDDGSYQVPVASWYEQITASLSGKTSKSNFTDYCNSSDKSSLILNPISEEEYKDYIRDIYANENIISEIFSTFESVDMSASDIGDESKRRPLFLLMILILLRDNYNCNLSDFSNYLSLLFRTVEIEKKKQSEDFKAQMSHKYQSQNYEYDLFNEMALITACIGQHDISELRKKYQLSDSFMLQPIEPDMLGEYFVLRAIDDRIKFNIATDAKKFLRFTSDQPFISDVSAFIEQCFTDSEKNINQFFIRCIQDFEVEIPGETLTYAEKCVFDVVKQNCVKLIGG